MKITHQQLSASLALPPIATGKTKSIHELSGDPSKVIVLSRDDITAGDGAKHDLIPEKGNFSNRTTCNVFNLLNKCGVPLAFDPENFSSADDESSDKHWFVADKCNMFPYEIVVRREAYGSYLKRNPDFEKGHRFPSLVSESFLKTNGRKWKEKDLICDDPFMIHLRGYESICLYNPNQPLVRPSLVLSEMEVFTVENEAIVLLEMHQIAMQTFLILEAAWKLQSLKLIDFKVEFGLNPRGDLVLADVIDADSWRLLTTDGEHLDKDPYRQGAAVAEIFEKYRYIAQLSDLFNSLSGDWYKS